MKLPAMDMLFVPSSDDLLLIPRDSCDRCIKEKTSYWKRWNDMCEDEIRLLLSYDVRTVRVRCNCYIQKKVL